MPVKYRFANADATKIHPVESRLLQTVFFLTFGIYSKKFFMRVILSVVGYTIAIVSAFFIFAFVIDLTSGDECEPGVMVGLIVFFILVGGSGVLLLKKSRQYEAEKQERMVLELAASKNGRITPAEIAMETSLTANESQEILDGLCQQGITEA